MGNKLYLFMKFASLEEEVTPVTGSSQSSQRSKTKKRKLADEEQ